MCLLWYNFIEQEVYARNKLNMRKIQILILQNAKAQTPFPWPVSLNKGCKDVRPLSFKVISLTNFTPTHRYRTFTKLFEIPILFKN